MEARSIRRYGLVGVGLLLAGVMLLPGRAITEPLDLKRGPISPEVRKEIQKQKIPPPRTDLRVLKIFAQDCRGTCESEDAFSMHDIYVEVGNYRYDCPTAGGSITGGGVQTHAKLTVKYYDVSIGSPRVYIRSISNMEVGKSYTLRVKRGSLCIRQSDGIQAEIQPTGIVKDPCQDNNVMVVYECHW